VRAVRHTFHADVNVLNGKKTSFERTYKVFRLETSSIYFNIEYFFRIS